MMRLHLVAAALLLSAFSAAPPAPAALSAAQLIGARLVLATGAPVGTITDLLCEGQQDRIADLVIARGNAAVAVPFVALSPGAASGTFVAASPVALAQALGVGDALNGDPRLLDVGHGLIGRPLVASDGTPVGTVAGLMLDAKTGAVTNLEVAPAAAGQPAKVLPWSAVADLFVERAIILNLTAPQVAALPSSPALQAASR